MLACSSDLFSTASTLVASSSVIFDLCLAKRRLGLSSERSKGEKMAARGRKRGMSGRGGLMTTEGGEQNERDGGRRGYIGHF